MKKHAMKKILVLIMIFTLIMPNMLGTLSFSADTTNFIKVHIKGIDNITSVVALYNASDPYDSDFDELIDLVPQGGFYQNIDLKTFYTDKILEFYVYIEGETEPMVFSPASDYAGVEAEGTINYWLGEGAGVAVYKDVPNVEDDQTEFEFGIWIKEKNNDEYPSDPEITFTLKDGEEYYNGSLENGYYYMIAETENSDYTTAQQSYEFKVNNDNFDAAFTFVNTRNFADLSGYKFNDLNGDGVWDDGEPGLMGVTIFVDYNGDGELNNEEPFTVTDKNGFYSFSNLNVGTWNIYEVEDPDWIQTYPTDPAYNTVELVAGEETEDINFGNQEIVEELYDISGYVFEDTPAYDYSDVESTRFANINITLTGVSLQLTSVVETDSDGYYEFTDLEPGEYTVTADTDNEMTDLPVSDKDGGTLELYTTTLSSDEDDVNFGYYTEDTPDTYSISGYVFMDPNENNLKDGDETGYAEIEVAFTGYDSTYTNASGYYEFTNIPSGYYGQVSVEGEVPDKQVSEFDRDPVNSPPFDEAGSVLVDGNKTNLNFGYYENEPDNWIVQGYVFYDQDEDNVKDAGEAGYPGITLYLDGNPDHFAITNSEGYYLFNQIPGTSGDVVLTVETTVPADYEVTEYDETLDETVNVEFGSGYDAPYINFGYKDEYVQPVRELSIDKSVDDDRIKLGRSVTFTVVVWNSGDETLYGVEVDDDRYGPLGVIDTLEPGYENRVTYEYDYEPTRTGTFVNTATAVAIEQAGPVEDDAEVDVYKDPPEPSTYSISGYVFEDNNSDNEVNGDDFGYAGITVELYDDDDDLVDTDTTSSSGKYSFGDLKGTYTVVVDPLGEIPDNFDSASQVSEYDDTLNQEVTLSVTGNKTQVNFGYIGTPLALPTIISGNVFNDLNEDNAVDSGEIGYSNVEVTLWDGAYPILTKVTDADGQYVFNFALDPELADLGPGLYVVSIGDTPVNINQVSEYDGSPFNQMVILTVEEDTIIIPDVNFGFKDTVVPSGETANIPMILAGLFLITSGVVLRRKSYYTN